MLVKKNPFTVRCSLEERKREKGKGEHLTYHTFGLTAQLKRKELSGGESSTKV